ncbi:hypothetical protein ZIOFF_050031 [Zingiber officinale]|uniref:Uncharacterized protein n=1 Tax=Zingiber officinale TaxID=94328 RepID=A0A8J5FQH5_ZINOF|nr:hypothetical protein ZIOFF_050031 [Zingiber officinale]
MQRAGVMIKGPGLGRDAALRAICRSGDKVSGGQLLTIGMQGSRQQELYRCTAACKAAEGVPAAQEAAGRLVAVGRPEEGRWKRGIMELKTPPMCECGNEVMILRETGDFSARPGKYYYQCPVGLKYRKCFF